MFALRFFFLFFLFARWFIISWDECISITLPCEWDKRQRERRWLQATHCKKNVCYTNWLHAVDIRIKRSEKSPMQETSLIMMMTATVSTAIRWRCRREWKTKANTEETVGWPNAAQNMLEITERQPAIAVKRNTKYSTMASYPSALKTDVRRAHGMKCLIIENIQRVGISTSFWYSIMIMW